jgi:fatty-acyl-CoA synthase
MTELSAVSTCTTLEHSLLEDNSSVGTAMPHTSIKIVDEKGIICPVDAPGELWVSGYLVHLGYYRNEGKTAEALHTDETGKVWLRTGDIVAADSAGRCRVVGRSKDMIKKRESSKQAIVALPNRLPLL